jgi:ribonuclease VapC
MIVDTSALLAILQDEAERRGFNEAIEAAESRRISAATLVEASIVIEARCGAEGLRALDRQLEVSDMEIVPVDVEQARMAREGYFRCGKGRQAAALNFGDCFSYALATVLREPLLFKGEGFGQTDVVRLV